MATISVINAAGSAVGDVEVNDEWLVRDRGDQAVHEEVVAYLAGRRAGTASTRNRAKVHGSGAKPWRQKGTGRARAGTRKSPVWRGGGTAFGPQPRSYAKKVNKKVRRLALRRAFTQRLDDDAIIVVDAVPADSHKTRDAVNWLEQIGAGEHTLILCGQTNHNFALACRNLPDVLVLSAATVNVYQLLLFDRVVIAHDAIDIIATRLSGISTPTTTEEPSHEPVPSSQDDLSDGEG